MKHRDIQPAHEKSVLDSFGSYLKEQGIVLTVVSRPDPPDAFVKVNDEPCWIEITDAFQSMEWARSITSYAADDKPHQPYKNGLIHEPDYAACEKVKSVILKKYNKKTMNNIFSKNGQGILLVGAYTPLTSPEEIIELYSETILSEIKGNNSVFKSIYLYRNLQDKHVFSKLL